MTLVTYELNGEWHTEDIPPVEDDDYENQVDNDLMDLGNE